MSFFFQVLVPLGPVAAGVIVAVVFFAWGWARAARFRSERGKPPWSISPTGWGAIHVALLPIAWILYFAATRTTTVSDLSLAHRDDAVIADTAEERHKLSRSWASCLFCARRNRARGAGTPIRSASGGSASSTASAGRER